MIPRIEWYVTLRGWHVYRATLEDRTQEFWLYPGQLAGFEMMQQRQCCTAPAVIARARRFGLPSRPSPIKRTPKIKFKNGSVMYFTSAGKER